MDIKLHCIEKGEGFPLILLHGNGESSDYFSHQIEFFSKNYRVIAVDTRGHGRSPRGDRPFTIIQFARDLYAFMNERHIPKAHILGFSDGGNIALIFALKHPERVEKLVLNGANLYPSGMKPSVQIPIVAGYCLASFAAAFRPNALKNKELLRLMVKEPHIRPKSLSSLRVKTLVIAGNRDMIKQSHTKLIYKSLPDARLSIIPGDHFIALKNPDAFNKTVARFLLLKSKQA